MKTSSFSLHPILVEKRSSANVKTFSFCSSPDLSGKIGLCEHEDLFCSSPDFSGEMEFCRCKDTFFCSSPDFSGKTTQGSILSHIFQKGAIVQKKLKAPVLALKNLGKFLLT